jgi:hypothetical protein
VSEPLTADDDAVDLLDAIGQADADRLREAPDDLLRRLFGAFRLSVTYDGRTSRALCRAVVSDDTLPTIQAALDAIARATRPAGTGWRHIAAERPGRTRQESTFVCVWRPRQDAGQGEPGEQLPAAADRSAGVRPLAVTSRPTPVDGTTTCGTRNRRRPGAA